MKLQLDLVTRTSISIFLYSNRPVCEEPFAGHTKLCPRNASASRSEAKPGNAAVSR